MIFSSVALLFILFILFFSLPYDKVFQFDIINRAPENGIMHFSLWIGGEEQRIPIHYSFHIEIDEAQQEKKYNNNITMVWYESMCFFVHRFILYISCLCFFSRTKGTNEKKNVIFESFFPFFCVRMCCAPYVVWHRFSFIVFSPIFFSRKNIYSIWCIERVIVIWMSCQKSMLGEKKLSENSSCRWYFVSVYKLLLARRTHTCSLLIRWI